MGKVFYREVFYHYENIPKFLQKNYAEMVYEKST